MASMWCATINYCGALFRPSFCPSCLGNTLLEPHQRITSWTKHNKLFTHLRSHPDVMQWPSSCPYPLCTAEFGDESLFLYHLKDLHGLPVPEAFYHKARIPSNAPAPIKWDHAITDQKRKRDQDQKATLHKDIASSIQSAKPSQKSIRARRMSACHSFVRDPTLSTAQSASVDLLSRYRNIHRSNSIRDSTIVRSCYWISDYRGE